MLKKTIKYTNFDGVEVEEDFYFHISKAELAKLQILHSKYDDGFSGYLKAIVDAKDPKQIMNAFEEILRLSYGIRSEDGRRFVKSETLFDEFKQTEAYSELYYGLVTDAINSSEFVKALLPSDVVNNAKEIQVALPTAEEETPEVMHPSATTEKPIDEMTIAELQAMPRDEFIRRVGTNPQKMTRNQLVVAMKHRINA